MSKENITNAELLNHIINIKENVSGINQHLKDMNGRLVTQDACIKNHDTRLNNIDKKIAYWGGGIAVVATVVNLTISALF